MARAAKVTSIDAVVRMATALQAFRSEAGGALDDLQQEIQRALEWIHHDCKEYWADEVRRGWQEVTEARLALQHATTYRRVADHQPTCVDEKRALAAAKRRLQLAQEKVEAVRHWSRVIERAVDEYRAARSPLATFLEADLPRAVAVLDRMNEALQSYVALGVAADPAPAAPPAPATPPPAAADTEPQP